MDNLAVHAAVHPRIQDIQALAREGFEQSDWPQVSEEEWRRSDISVFNFSELESPETELVHNTRAERKSLQIISLNDALRDSTTGEGTAEAAQSARARSLAPEAIRAACEYLTMIAENAVNRIELWNIAQSEDIFMVHVPKQSGRAQNGEESRDAEEGGAEEAQQPELHEMCWHSLGENVSRHVTFIVLVDDACTGEVLLRLKGMEGHVQNVLAIYALGNEARLKVTVLQESSEEVLSFYQARVMLGRDSQFEHFEGIVGAGYIKNRVDVEMQGAGSQVNLNGLYLAHEDQHIDLRTVQQHQAEHCESRALYKGVVLDEAEAIYQGLIEVTHEARGTDAYLTNNVLLLSDEAKSDSIPSLNIKTDDVKCSHGSTTGRINEEHIFYFQTRGFSRAEAMEFLVLGFLDELIVQIPEAQRERFRSSVQKKLHGAAH